MLYDFTKLRTFMIVVKEKSFSRASMKMGVSQPAVTQQIKHLESYFNTKIIVRRKSGIGLTKEGEELLLIASKIDKILHSHQKEIMHNIHRKEAVKIVCSPTIGNFILPTLLPKLTKEVYPNIQYSISTSLKAIEDLQCGGNGAGEIKMALIESPIFREDIVYREWLEDEIILASTAPLPRVIKEEDLFAYEWINLSLGTHKFAAIKNYLEKLEIEVDKLKISKQFETYQEVKKYLLRESQKKSKRAKRYMAFLPYLYIKDELQKKQFYYSKIRGLKLKRRMYLAFCKEDRNDSLIENIGDYLIFNTKIPMY
ncbi:transcriptional regulator [Helicobacter pullorum]|uniref:LysR family transcriptional regulator n=1 Tax=Helicobacter pullorum TaxID=35818 RepID=UPI0008169D09|nr:LysR family transcriptional regulator [Helicobacter pullorum]OCR16872.1 transcriptional regulator [Helicobacter pullorum]OCR17592.1 transcriptional regulator [Helicobacter pullorum]